MRPHCFSWVWDHGRGIICICSKRFIASLALLFCLNGQLLINSPQFATQIQYFEVHLNILFTHSLHSYINIKPLASKTMIHQDHQSNSNLEFSSIANFTNQILVVDHIQTKGCKTYYIPAYLRAKLKNIVQMDFEKLMAKVNVDFILDVYYGGLSQDDKNHLEDNMVLIFPRDTPVKLQKQNQKLVSVKEDKDNCFRYTIRKVIEVEILSDIRWAPFETASIIISANLRKTKRLVPQKIKIKEHWVKYKFNFMDVKGDEFHDLKFSLGTERSFGFYNIAEKQMRVIYDNKYENPNQKDDIEEMGNTIDCYNQCFGDCFQSDSKKHRPGDEEADELISYTPQLTYEQKKKRKENEQKKPHKKIDAFQYAYFILPMYKAPYSMTALVMLQLLLIGTVNVCIFYQDMTLSGKQMLNMAALMVSLVGILPNIRESMGRSSQITLAQVCTIFQTFTVILTFIHMIQKINIKEGDKTNYVLGEQGLAIVCIIITGLISVILLGCLLIHLLFWKNGYHFRNKKHQVMWFERRYWQNSECDNEFRRSVDYQEGRICMLKPPTGNDGKEDDGKAKKSEKKEVIWVLVKENSEQ